MRKFLGILAIAVMGAALSLPAQADTLTFFGNLTGANEAPTPVATNATGRALLTFDTATRIGNVRVDFSGLTAGLSVSHIHAGARGVAGPVLYDFDVPGSQFPRGTTSGTILASFTLVDKTVGPATNPVTFSVAEQLSLLFNQGFYFNVHSTAFPGGEIRDQVQAVPEPATMLLLGTGLAGLAARYRRRRQS